MFKDANVSDRLKINMAHITLVPILLVLLLRTARSYPGLEDWSDYVDGDDYGELIRIQYIEKKCNTIKLEPTLAMGGSPGDVCEEPVT